MGQGRGNADCGFFLTARSAHKRAGLGLWSWDLQFRQAQGKTWKPCVNGCSQTMCVMKGEEADESVA